MHVNGLQILENLNIMHTIRLKKSFGKNDVILNDTNNEPRHSISYKIACAPSEDSDQTARSDQSSLSTWRGIGSLATYMVPCEDSDQTVRMRRLIWVTAGRICNLVGNAYPGSSVFLHFLVLESLNRQRLMCLPGHWEYQTKFDREVENNLMRSTDTFKCSFWETKWIQRTTLLFLTWCCLKELCTF